MDGQHGHRHDNRQAYRDPVCGMTSDEEGAFTPYQHQGTTYYFCSAGCLEKFQRNPAAYGPDAHETHSSSQGEKDRPAATTYTCPMHPEIVRRHLPIPAPCIRRSCGTGPAVARNAAWRWSP